MTLSNNNNLKQQIKTEAYEWHILISSGEATSKDHQNFEKWRLSDQAHQQAYDRASKLWESFSELTHADIESLTNHQNLAQTEQVSRTAYWQKLFSNQIFGLINFKQATALTAVIAAILLIQPLLVQNKHNSTSITHIIRSSYKTNIAELKTVTLPDGSTATLGANTELKIEFSNKRRNLYIEEGAAIFDVISNPTRPFIVTADRIKATALGTIFEVRRNGGVTRIAVDEGSVSVTKPKQSNNLEDNKSVTNVSFGEYLAVTANSSEMQVKKFDKGSFGSWQKGRLEYQAATLNELVADANRYSDKRITIIGDSSKLSNLKVTAFFDATDINSMVETLPDIFPVEISNYSANEIFLIIK